MTEKLINLEHIFFHSCRRNRVAMSNTFDYGSSDDDSVNSDFDDEEVYDSNDDDDDDEKEDSGSGDEDESLFISKDGTEWSKTPIRTNPRGRKRSYEVMHTRPGVTSYSTSRVHDETSAFKLSFDDGIIQMVIKHTNEKGVEKMGDSWIPVDEIEFDAFLGLLILAAVYKSNKEPLDSLWHDTLGRPFFRATMSAKRFQTIYRMIRLDDKTERSTEKGAGIKTFWEMWNSRQTMLLNPDEVVTVDEQLVAFRGRVFCRQYMPSKPAKYGLKFFNACCSLQGFILQSQLYPGKQGNKREVNQGQRVTEDLVVGKGFEGRTVVVDRFSTSYELGKSLLKNRMGMVGTIRANKRCIPSGLRNLGKRKVLSSRFAHTDDGTMVSYHPKKGKNVLLYSTVHHDQRVNLENEKRNL